MSTEFPKSSQLLLVFHLCLLIRCLNGLPTCPDDLTLFPWASAPGYHCILPSSVNIVQNSLDFNFAVLICNASSGGLAVNLLANQPILLSKVTFLNCSSSANGGAIRTSCSDTADQCSLLLTDAVFADCSSTGSGGAICAASNIQLTNCTFDQCRAAQDGGAIFATQGSATLTDCLFTGNRADINSGAISGTALVALLVQNSSFLGNSARDYSTIGVTFTGGPIEINGCQFLSNYVLSVTSAIAGAVYLSSFNLQPAAPPARVTDCMFFDNSGYAGAAIYTSRPTVVSSCRFENNRAERGGAIYSAGDLMLTDSVFINNSAVGFGGGVFINGATAQTYVTNCLFVGCWGGSGGSIYGFKNVGNPLVVGGCRFLNSFAFGLNAANGGAIAMQSGWLELSDSEFRTCNSSSIMSSSSGGALSILYGNISNCLFVDCTTSPKLGNNAAGGAISANLATTDALNLNCTVFRGCASTFGGSVIDVFSLFSAYVRLTDCSVEGSYDLAGPLSTVGPNATAFAFRPAVTTTLSLTLTRFYIDVSFLPDCQNLGQGTVSLLLDFASRPTCNLSLSQATTTSSIPVILGSSPPETVSANFSELIPESTSPGPSGTDQTGTTSSLVDSTPSLVDTRTVSASFVSTMENNLTATTDRLTSSVVSTTAQFTLVGNVQITWIGTTLKLVSAEFYGTLTLTISANQVLVGDELTLYQFVSSAGQFDNLVVNSQSGCIIDGTLTYYETSVVFAVTQIDCTTSGAVRLL